MNLIYKAKKDADHPYVMILRETLYDLSLSLKAKGLLCFILSKPVDWQIYVTALSKELKESKSTVANTINELIECGYCIRQKHHRNDKGYFQGYDYIFFENKGEREKWKKKHT